MKFFISSLFILSTLFLNFGLAKVSYDAVPTKHFNDYSHTFSAETIIQVETQLIQFEKKTGIQFAIIFFNSIEGEAIEDLSNQIFTQWKLGQKSTNNGLLAIFSINDRKVRIETGYGLESKLTDAKSSQIIRYDLRPFLKSGRYDLATFQLIKSVDAVFTGETSQKSSLVKKKLTTPLILLIIMFSLFFLSQFSSGNHRTISGQGINRRRNPFFFGFPGGWGGGGGGGWGSGGSSGSGWGGGGGMSGGGGASGDW